MTPRVWEGSPKARPDERRKARPMAFWQVWLAVIGFCLACWTGAIWLVFRIF